MKDEYGFCFHCGANLEPGAEYCPECGQSFIDDSNSASYQNDASKPMNFLKFMLGAYFVLSVVSGLYTTVFIDSYLANIESLTNIDSYLASMGVESVSQLADIMYIQGIVSIIDGAMVGIVFLLCILCRYWKTAVAVCFAASFVVLAGIPFMTTEMMNSEVFTLALQTIVGLLITRGIYVNKRAFK